MKRSILILFALVNFFLSLAKNNDNLPVFGFIENKGQIHDQNFNPRPDVKYLLSLPGFNLQLKNNSFSYDTYTIIKNTSKKKKPSKFNFHRLDIEFLNANPKPQIIAEEPCENYTNYYLQNNISKEASNAKNFKKITYKELYPNIDLEFLFSEGIVKYNFILHHGAELSQIKWVYKGSNNNYIKDKDIEIKLHSGIFRETIPASYFTTGSEKITPVKISFTQTTKNIYGFKSDKNIFLLQDEKLIIDPTPQIVWATYKGGTGDEVLTSICTDPIGNIYACGWTVSTGAIATSGAYQVSYGGGSFDAMVMKYNNSGALQWATYYGGAGDEMAATIAIDKAYNLFVCGPTTSTAAIATSSVYQGSYGGGTSDGFLVKFDTNGVRQWATYYGGSSYDDLYGCSIDKVGNIYVSGSTTSTNAIATGGAYQTAFAGGAYDAYLVKFDNNGVRQWATYYGDSGDDQSPTCANDPIGNIYMAGISASTVSIASAGSHQTAHGGGTYDGYMVKFNANGLRKWATYYGGNADDVVQCLRYDTLDINRGLYLTGNTSSTNSIASSGAQQTVNNGSDDAFIVRFDTSGTRLWGTYFGGPGNEGGYSAITDNSNVYLVGFTQSFSSISTPTVLQTTHGGGMADAYIAKYSKSGVLQWSTYYGKTGYDNCLSNAMDKFGNLFITGTTSSASMTTVGANQTAYGGGPHDGFTTKLFQPASTVGVEEVQTDVNSALKIYPNPSVDSFTLKSKENCSLDIINELGQTVMNLKLDNSNNHQVTISNLPLGVYFITNQSDNTITKNKLVVIK